MKSIELMVAMFDRDMNGTISYPEFTQLFGYVQRWMACFRQYDMDRSGAISSHEMQTALSSFGFRLSPQFINLLIRKFDRTRRGQIAFDDFIYCCVCLQVSIATYVLFSNPFFSYPPGIRLHRILGKLCNINLRRPAFSIVDGLLSFFQRSRSSIRRRALHEDETFY